MKKKMLEEKSNKVGLTQSDFIRNLISKFTKILLVKIIPKIS